MFKKIAFCLTALFVLVLLVLSCVPMILSTSYGKKKISAVIYKQTGFQVHIEELSLSWLGEQHARGITAQNVEDEATATCSEIATDASLWQVLFRKDWGKIQVISPSLQIARPFLPTSSAAPVPSIKTAGFTPLATMQLDLPVNAQITVTKGKVELTPAGLEPIRFEEIAATLDVSAKETMKLQLDCQTNQQGVSGKIGIAASASQLNSSFPALSLDANIVELPVLGIDQLASLFMPSLNGIIYAAIGPKIDIQCQLKANQGNFDISFNAKSPQMSAQITTQTDQGVISLKSPATCSFTVTPAAVQKWAKISPSWGTLALDAPAVIQGTLSTFSCPIPEHASDLLKAAVEAKITAPSPVGLSVNGTPLPLNNLILTLSSASLENQIAISFAAGTKGGSLALNGNLSQPFLATRAGSFNLSATQFPIDLISLAVGNKEPLSPFLGQTVDLKGILDFKEVPELHLSWNSSLLTIPSLDLSLGSTATLTSPATLTLQLNPNLFPQLKTSPIVATLEQLAIPRDQLQNMRLKASLKMSSLAVSTPFFINVSDLQASLVVNTWDQISLDAKGNPFQLMVSGAFRANTSEFVLNKPLTVQYTIDNKVAPNLAKPATFQLVIDPMSLPRATQLKGKLSSNEIALGSAQQVITLQNTSLPFQWDLSSKSATVQLSSNVKNPTGQAGSMQGQFQLSGFSTDTQIDLSQASILGTLDLQNLSSALLDAFFPKIPLSVVAGDHFSSHCKVQSTPAKQNIALKWTSPYLNIDSAFVIDNTGIKLQGNTQQLSWILTPESYALLDQMMTGPKSGPKTNQVPFQLSEQSTFTISLSKLFFPVIPKQNVATLSDRIPEIAWDLDKLQLGATGRNSKLAFLDKTSKETIQLSNLTFSLNKTGQEPLTAVLETAVATLSESNAASAPIKSGSLSLTTTLNTQEHFDLSQLTGNLQMKVQQFPSRALDIIARAKGRADFPFTTLFGEMINASISTQMKNFSGPIALNLNTPRARIDLKGQLVNGALTLSDTLYAQMKVTPEISRLVLKEVNPLNLSYFYSEAPITLEIQANGFYFPLSPTNVGKIAMPNARIELGKVACRNEGNVNITLGLLKSKQFDKSGELFLWFAPIDFSIKQGIADIERTEILLADTFDVCVFGKFDLVKAYVDMILGLTAQTLSKAFGIKNLPENYVLTVPMKGPADNVQINTNKATAKVALLLAWQHKDVAGAFGGGSVGPLVGEMLGRIATLPDANAKVPPPKHPFPWEVGNKGKKTSEASSSSGEKKRQFKANDKPLKQIFKVIR
jgi:hypothetical protein